MSTYRRYQDARDAAWRALLKVQPARLPVDAEALAGQVGVELLPFPGPQEERLRHMLGLAGRGVCVSLRIKGQWYFFLREQQLSDSQRRFAVAHELGHLFLLHETRSLAPGVRAFLSSENAGDLMEDPDSLDDYAADIFAIRLLAPACLLHEMHMDQSGQIMAQCGLPPRAAALRAERMTLLNERNAFYQHTLERQVRDRFLPFLRERVTAQAPPPHDRKNLPIRYPLPDQPAPADEADIDAGEKDDGPGETAGPPASDPEHTEEPSRKHRAPSASTAEAEGQASEAETHPGGPEPDAPLSPAAQTDSIRTASERPWLWVVVAALSLLFGWLFFHWFRG